MPETDPALVVPLPAEAADPLRLAVLAEYRILDTPSEQGFDDVVALATQICAAPVALVSFVDRDRQWFKARIGFEARETPLDQSVCVHALGRADILEIADLAEDARTRANPLVTGEPRLRFYVGVPLTAPGGQVLGTLCALDHAPRPPGLADAQRAGLQALARQVTTLLTVRRAATEREALIRDLQQAQRRAVDERRRLTAMFEQAPSFIAMLHGPNHAYELANPAYRRLIGHRDVTGKTVAEALPDAAAQGYVDLLDRVYRTGEAYASKGARYAVQAEPSGTTMERYVDFVFQPVLDAEGRVGGIFVEGSDVTDRVRHAARQAALADLGERLRDLKEVGAITQTAAELLARTLGAARAGFGTVDLHRETVQMQPNWCAPGVTAVLGQHRFRDYGSFIDDLKRGEMVIIPDVTEDPRTRENAEALLGLSIRALANLPIIEQGSFVLVVFVHYDRPHDWAPEELAFLRQVGDRTQAALGRVKAEEQQRILNQELSHRLKNTLAMVQAIAGQTLRSVTERPAVAAFTQRIHALASAHNVLLQQAWVGASMKELVQAVLATFDQSERFIVEGPEVELGPRAALSLSLLLHELGTNAVKYGALSGPRGQVGLTWRFEGEKDEVTLVLHWRERGGPPVQPPEGGGFGSRLIGMGLTGTGRVSLRYEPSGFEAEMKAPLSQLQRS